MKDINILNMTEETPLLCISGSLKGRCYELGYWMHLLDCSMIRNEDNQLVTVRFSSRINTEEYCIVVAHNSLYLALIRDKDVSSQYPYMAKQALVEYYNAKQERSLKSQ